MFSAKRLSVLSALILTPFIACAGYGEEPAATTPQSTEAPKQVVIEGALLNQIVNLLNTPAGLQGISTMQAAALIQQIQQNAKPAPQCPAAKEKPKKKE